MTAQLTKKERDYIFSEACYALRETSISDAKGIRILELGHALINSGVDVKTCEVRGENIIFFAIDNFAPAVLKFIFLHGATLDVTNHEGKTPVEFAKAVLNDVESKNPTSDYQIKIAKYNLLYLEESALREKSKKFIEFIESFCGLRLSDLNEGNQEAIKDYIKENSIDLNKIIYQYKLLVFWLIENLSPALLKFFVYNGLSLEVLGTKGVTQGITPLDFAERILSSVTKKFPKTSHYYLLAEETVAFLKQ